MARSELDPKKGGQAGGRHSVPQEIRARREFRDDLVEPLHFRVWETETHRKEGSWSKSHSLLWTRLFDSYSPASSRFLEIPWGAEHSQGGEGLAALEVAGVGVWGPSPPHRRAPLH